MALTYVYLILDRGFLKRECFNMVMATGMLLRVYPWSAAASATAPMSNRRVTTRGAVEHV